VRAKKIAAADGEGFFSVAVRIGSLDLDDLFVFRGKENWASGMMRIRLEKSGFLNRGLVFAFESGLFATSNRAKALLELVDATLGINEGGLTGEEGVCVGGDTHGDYKVLYTVNFFGFIGLSGRTCDELLTTRHVLEDNGMVVGMNICFHSGLGLHDVSDAVGGGV